MRGIQSVSLAVAMMAALSTTAPVQAASKEEMDMTKITCKQAGEMGADFAAGLIFWIDGYISKEKNNPMMSEQWMADLASIVKEGCAETPNKSMLKIVRDGMK